MTKAVWNGVVIAESDETIKVEEIITSHRSAIRAEYFTDSSDHTVCPWKGTASYYDVVVDGHVNSGAAWYYPDPKPAASDIKGYVAFWRGVKVQSS